jgi:hypothetical protein
MSDHQQKGIKVKPTEHNAKTPSDKTGIFATLRVLLRGQGSGAPSLTPVLAVSGQVTSETPRRMIDFMAARDRGRSRPSSARTQGADLGGANGKTEDAARRSVSRASSGPGGSWCRPSGSSRVRFGRGLACAVALCAFLGSSAPAFGAVTAKSVTGFFGATGTAGGQLTTPRGTGVNQTSGNVYTVDGGNNRISVFNSSGTFLRTFGQDVVSSGPDNNGTGYEICVAANGDVCKAGITGATGGVLNGPQGLAVDQTTGNVYVTDGSNQRVQQYDANGTFLRAFGQDVVESGPGNSPAANAVQSLNVTATAGKYTLSFSGKTTPELEYNATAAQVQTALTALTSIGAGNVEVTGASMPYTITFKGALANNFEPVITVASGVGAGNELEGGAASVTTVTPGSSGFEVCVATNGDVCQKGLTASTGGALKSTFNGYPTVAPAGSPNAGDVLVADPANLRVQEYTSAGAFVRTFGFDVVAAGPDGNGTAFEVCTAAKGDACKIGVSGSGSGQFANSVNRVAEDAAGNLYTVESGTPNFRVQKFTLPGNVVTPQGNFSEANTKGTAAASAPFDVAIDPSDNDVLVTKAFAAGATPTCPNTGVASLAERRIVEVSSIGTLEATHMGCAGINVVNGLAVRGSTGDIYVASTTTESRLYVLNAPLTAPTVGFSGISGITAHSAIVSGFVNPNGPTLAYGLTTGYHVNLRKEGEAAFTPAPASDVNVGRGLVNASFNQQLTGLVPNAVYEVQIVASRGFNAGQASTATFSFSTPAAAPEISPPFATAADPTGTKAGLYGFVNPNNQATTYRFEYGTTTDYGTSVPAPDGSAGSGATSAPVKQLLSGLTPGTTYHYRLRANNPSGGVLSPDGTFTTPSPTEAGQLPDNRAFELVSPADKRPSGGVYVFFNGAQLTFQGADDGNAIDYVIQGGLADSTKGGEVVYTAQRGSEGWMSTQAAPPALVPSPVATAPSRFNYFNKDISCGFTQTPSPITSDVPEVDKDNAVVNLYRRNPDGSFTLITNLAPSNPATATDPLGMAYIVAGASPNCDRVYFASTVYKLTPGASGLYEWNEGVLKDAGIRPDGSVAPPMPGTFEVAPRLGGDSTGPRATRYRAVSEDGSRLFFTSISNQGATNGKRAVFMREGDKTIDVTLPTTTTPTQGARFELATPDGSHVYFMANIGLAGPVGNGSQEDCTALSVDVGSTASCDIYDYNVETGTLTDLTTDTNPADPKGAASQGIVGVSGDGSYVYFAAKGQLLPGAGKTFSENTGTTKTSNIYLRHDGQLQYVASVLDQDLSGNAVGGGHSAGGMLARWSQTWSSWVTPSGRDLVFESRANLAGYNSGSKEIVYHYSADTEQLQCVSCRADGQPSPTEADIGVGNQLPGPVTPETQIALHYARPMSDDGSKVFFISRDPLAPAAVEGQRNLYEWENGRVHLLQILGTKERLADTSADGSDVFFTSAQQLVGQDFDNEIDLYDARTNGGFPPPPPAPVPCEPAADECQGPTNPAPAVSSPASESFSGPGSPPPSSKHHRKKHRKKHKRHQRKSRQKATGGNKPTRLGIDNRGGVK